MSCPLKIFFPLVCIVLDLVDRGHSSCRGDEVSPKKLTNRGALALLTASVRIAAPAGRPPYTRAPIR